MDPVLRTAYLEQVERMLEGIPGRFPPSVPSLAGAPATPVGHPEEIERLFRMIQGRAIAVREISPPVLTPVADLSPEERLVIGDQLSYLLACREACRSVTPLYSMSQQALQAGASVSLRPILEGEPMLCRESSTDRDIVLLDSGCTRLQEMACPDRIVLDPRTKRVTKLDRYFLTALSGYVVALQCYKNRTLTASLERSGGALLLEGLYEESFESETLFRCLKTILCAYKDAYLAHPELLLRQEIAVGACAKHAFCDISYGDLLGEKVATFLWEHAEAIESASFHSVPSSKHTPRQMETGHDTAPILGGFC